MHIANVTFKNMLRGLASCVLITIFKNNKKNKKNGYYLLKSVYLVM